MKLLALTLCAFVAITAAWSSDSSRSRSQWNDDSSPLTRVKPFSSGYVHRYRYDFQIASGLGTSEDMSNGNQQATYRLSSMVNLHFESDRTAVLRMDDIKVAALNGELPELRRVQPMDLFEDKEISSEKLEELRRPCRVELVDGLVERINFDSRDTTWSKNIKRGFLNMIQLNLKQRSNVQGLKDELSSEDRTSSSTNNMFTIPEISIEGACLATYVISKTSEDTFNVTKSIDFKRCKVENTYLPLVYYGSRIEKPTVSSKIQELEEQQLERSTVIRYQVKGTPENYQGIINVESLSQYMYKTFAAEQQAMQSVVTGRVVIDSVEKTSDRSTSGNFESKEDTLLYSTEWDRDEKRFYQYGDEEFKESRSPFADVPNKSRKIQLLIDQLVQATTDKVQGIETEDVLKLQQIVELIRMCRVPELEEIRSAIESKKPNVEIFYDACAISATANTIKFLVSEIKNKEITPSRASMLLRQVQSSPAVSEKQVDLVMNLCHDQTVEQSVSLRQSCWLTVGSMIREICQESNRDDEICSRSQKEKYGKTLWKKYEEAENTYEKILALKTIGNSALYQLVQKLETVIVDRREPSQLRIQAIDALRRLRNEAPRKVQRVLLPVFKNTLEVPEVRMAAFSMLMHTIPDKAILDQITYILHSERSNHVRSFVVSCLRAYSVSPVVVEREMADRLRSALSMAKIDLDTECRYTRVPIYSESKQEGVFLNWVSMFSKDSTQLPKHMSVSIDSFLNNLFEKDTLSLSMTQNNIEDIYHRIFETLYGQADRQSTRGRRSSRNDGEQELDSLFDNLRIRTRDASENAPFGLLNLRLRDVDYAILPLGEEYMPAMIKNLMNGEQPHLSSLESILGDKPFSFNYALSLYERSMKVPTASGLPLRILTTTPALVSMKVDVKPQMVSKNLKVHVKTQPLISLVHIRKMELWCPIFNSGVENLRSVELNLPIDMEVNVLTNDVEKMKMIFHVPQQEIRLIGLHSLPVTFIRDYDATSKLHGTTHVKAIRNIVMEQRQFELNPREQPLTVSGHLHRPLTMDYTGILNMLFTTENHVEVRFERTSGCPKTIEMVVTGKAFEKIQSSSSVPKFENFYDNNRKFQPVYGENEDIEEYGLENTKERSQRLNKYLSRDYQSKTTYRHSFTAQIKTTGGHRDHKASTEFEAICDAQMAFCKLYAQVKRTPIFADERSEWTLEADSQILMPQYVRDLSELKNEKADRHNKLVSTLLVKWGANNKQKINLKLQGERAVPQKWIQRSGDEWRQILATAFINKYDLVADFDLKPEFQTAMRQYISLLKWWNWWNVDSSESMEGREDEIHATWIIDPRTRQHFNMSLKTPNERVRFVNLQMPMTMKPFTLVRPQEQDYELHSVDDMMSHYQDGQRAECRVDGRRVKTFDSSTFKSPIGKCYTTIASDCSEKKTFAVMMKTVDESTGAKNIKIVTAKRTIEAEMTSSRKLVVRVNGEKVDADRLDEYDIDFSEEDALIRCNLPEGVSVRFNGKQATVKLSHFYKNKQCGLCGHFDGEEENDFRMADDSVTDDLKEFHRSYSMDDEECKSVYDNEQLFDRESDRQSRRRGERRQESSRWDYDDDVEDYGLFHRDDEETTQNVEPIKKTIVQEFHHKICFSQKPITVCPRGTESTKTEKTKVSFTCKDRSDTEARRLLRDARTQDITHITSKLKNSFAEDYKTDRACA